MKYLSIYAALLLSAALALTACDETVIDPNDIDGDGVLNADDVDDDNDGLIEISTLAELNNVRFNMRGTSYDDEMEDADTGSTRGASTIEPANCSDGNLDPESIISLCGYELTADINFTTDAPLNTGSNSWSPIGDNIDRFNAIFEGNGYAINNLRINLSGTIGATDQAQEYLGLFGAVGADGYIRNLRLIDARVIDNRTTGDINNRYYVGSLAGRLFGGIVSGCSATSTSDPGAGMLIRGGPGDNDNVGGLIGRMEGGLIIASHVSGTSGDTLATVRDRGGNGTRIGGLVGGQYGGRIAASYVINTSIQNTGAMGMIGGLVGEQNGGSSTIIVASYTDTDIVSSTGGNNIGGLLGAQSGSGAVSASYTMGTVDTSSSMGGADANNIGGLVGKRDGVLSVVRGSYAIGDISGRRTDMVGVLVGVQPVIGSMMNDDMEVPISAPLPEGSYGFGTAMLGVVGDHEMSSIHPTAATEAQLTAINTGTCTIPIKQPEPDRNDPMPQPIEPNERNCIAVTGKWTSWNDLPTGNNAWIFGGGSGPRLRYADYDEDNSGIDYCDFFPRTIPGTSTRIVCGSTPLGGQ